jgi:drug/metabolite transporter (DMT)-like permease
MSSTDQAPGADAASASPAPRDDPHERRRGHTALLAVQLCYGLFPLFLLLSVESFAPRAVVVWRVLLGAAVFGGIALARHGAAVLPGRGRLQRGDLLRLVGCSLTGVVLNQTLALEGMARTTSANAGLLMTLIPVFTFLLAALTGLERFSPRRALGLGIALSGAVLLMLARTGAPELASQHLVGNLLIAGNCLSYSIYLILGRRLLERVPVTVLVAWSYALAVPAMLLVAPDGGLWPAEPTSRALLGFGYTLIFPTVIAYMLNAFALARVRASTTAVYIYLQPLVASVAGVLVLGEVLSPVWFVSAALLGAGIWLVARVR